MLGEEEVERDRGATVDGPEQTDLTITLHRRSVAFGPANVRRQQGEHRFRMPRIGSHVEVDVVRGPRLRNVVRQRECSADRVWYSGAVQPTMNVDCAFEDDER